MSLTTANSQSTTTAASRDADSLIAASLNPMVAIAVLVGILWRVPPDDSYTGYAFAGAGIVFLAASRSRREVVTIACLTPALLAAFRLMHASAPGPWLSSIAVGVGGASVIVAAVQAIHVADRQTELRRLAAVLAMPAFVLIAGMFISESATWQPLTYDGMLSAIDRSLGFDPSALAGMLLARSTALTWLCKIVYESLPMAICAAAAVQWQHPSDGPRAANALPSVVIAAVCAQLIFQIVPACGPRFLWGPAFPFQVASQTPHIGLLRVAPGEFRNAFPSLHMTGVLYITWATRPLGWSYKLPAWFYTGITALATLGSGQHYAVDLIVAVPFAMSVQLVIAHREPGRLAVSLALVAAWIGLVLWGTPLLVRIPGLTAGLAALSIGTSLARVQTWRPATSRGFVPALSPSSIEADID